MSTLFYKALIEANVTEATATNAAAELDDCKRDITSLNIRLDILLIGMGMLIALEVFDIFL